MWTSDPERMKAALALSWDEEAYATRYGTQAASAMAHCREAARSGDKLAFRFAMLQLGITLHHHVPWVYEKRAR